MWDFVGHASPILEVSAVTEATYADPPPAGAIEVVLQDGSSKTIGITRAHVEEDAGKLQPFHWLTLHCSS